MHPLLAIARSRFVNQLTGFAAEAGRLDAGELAGLYRSLQAEAPRRRSVGKSYFVGHTGSPASEVRSNRSEEHLAIALFNHNEAVALPGGRQLRILDYQFPLKARQTDRGVGKVDLFGVIEGTSVGIIELKHISDERTSLGDTPLRALLEALNYGAIVEANLADIVMEISPSRLERPPSGIELLVVATARYWQSWMGKDSAGRWQEPLANLSEGLTAELDLPIRFLTLDPIEFDMGLQGQKPVLRTEPALAPVPDLPS